MLPILTAFAFQEFALKGGSSQPCIVSVCDERGNFLKDSYVIKLFQHHNLNHTSKEVFASALAPIFDLKTPEPALIEVSHVLIQELKKQEKYKRWDIEEGVFFGCKYIPNAQSFVESLPLNQFAYWEILLR